MLETFCQARASHLDCLRWYRSSRRQCGAGPWAPHQRQHRCRWPWTWQRPGRRSSSPPTFPGCSGPTPRSRPQTTPPPPPDPPTHPTPITLRSQMSVCHAGALCSCLTGTDSDPHHVAFENIGCQLARVAALSHCHYKIVLMMIALFSVCSAAATCIVTVFVIDPYAIDTS